MAPRKSNNQPHNQATMATRSQERRRTVGVAITCEKNGGRQT